MLKPPSYFRITFIFDTCGITGFIDFTDICLLVLSWKRYLTIKPSLDYLYEVSIVVLYKTIFEKVARCV